MCVVSMIADHYRPLPIDEWTQVRWSEYQELKRKAEEYDRRNNEPNCELAEKIAWEKSVEEFIRKTYGLEPTK